MNTNVSVGPTSIAGWITSLALVAPAAVEQIVSLIENNSTRLAGPEKWLAILGIASFGVTQIGRYIQAITNKESIPLEPPAPSAAAGEIPAADTATTV